MSVDDSRLFQCSETELLEMAFAQGLGRLKRGLPTQDLVQIVAGYRNPTSQELSQTTYTRDRLERFVQSRWRVIRSQLPGCNGMCQSFKCSETRHMKCYLDAKPHMGDE